MHLIIKQAAFIGSYAAMEQWLPLSNYRVWAYDESYEYDDYHDVRDVSVRLYM